MTVTVAVRVTLVAIGSVAVTRPVPALVLAARTAARSTAGTVAGTLPMVPMAAALSRAGSMIVPTARSRTGASAAVRNGKGAELTGPRTLGPEILALMAIRAPTTALARPCSGPVAAIDPPAGPVSGAGTRSGRPACDTVAAARPGAGLGTASARWLGGRVRGSLRRGHRPIIARTAGGLCSPRPNRR
ncbi:hypothetical protein QFZ49_003929 [Streptomyces turgidiscabies]|uniref:Secreted protein n=1 Tax=Streptomyces turgidiscabies TaxID=85558 RepID=A0ABU0RPV4_9ACTN|nr:hypothetical protein [Streptomyces turgidiscabies]